MPKNTSNSRGSDLVKRLYDGRKQAQECTIPGARDVGILDGLYPSGTADIPLENVLVNAQQILTKSGKVFCYGNNVVMEITTTGEKKLVTLTTGSEVGASAATRLANLFVCECDAGPNKTLQFFAPPKFIAALLHREPTLAALPAIKLYALRPVFDPDFVLRDPGGTPKWASWSMASTSNRRLPKP